MQHILKQILASGLIKTADRSKIGQDRPIYLHRTFDYKFFGFQKKTNTYIHFKANLHTYLFLYFKFSVEFTATSEQ